MKTTTSKRKAIADAVELLKEESPNRTVQVVSLKDSCQSGRSLA